MAFIPRPYADMPAPPPPALVPHPARKPVTFLGPPVDPKDYIPRPYPGYMTPAEQLAFAQKQAEVFYAPTMAEIQHQQRLLHDQNLAQQAGIQAVYKALTGLEPGPYGQIAGQEGNLQYLSAVQEGNRAEQDLAYKLLGLKGQQGAKAQEILGGEQEQQTAYQKDRETRALQLYGAGLMTQRDVARQLGLPNPNQYPATVKGSNAAPSLRTVGGSLYAVDPTSGRTKLLIQAPKNPDKPVTRSVGGYIYQWDPQTGEWAPVAGAGPSAGKAPNLQHTTINGKAYVFNPGTGQFYDPATGASVVPQGPSARPPTPALVAKGWKLITASYPHLEGSNKRLDNAGLQRIYNQYKNVLGKNGIKSPDQLLAAPPAVKKLLGIVGGDRAPQDVYIDLIHSGIPPRKAWQMVRKTYPQWGGGYFGGPKGDAPAGTGVAGWPVPAQYTQVIGRPNQGSHTLYGNWQSDNAYDISVPVGTPIYAVADGKIGPRVGPFNSSDPHLGGSRLTIQTGDNAFYYAHLSRLSVKPGQRVKAGQLIGYSGSANGVAHLHIASEHGDPMQFMHAAGPPRTLAGANGVKQFAFSTATSKYGWGQKELAALDQLWGHESNWDPTAKNPSSGALGIPQALGHDLPPGYADNPNVQIAWGLDYIKSRYQTPSRAWAFWQATVNKNASQAPADLRRTVRIWISHGWKGY